MSKKAFFGHFFQKITCYTPVHERPRADLFSRRRLDPKQVAIKKSDTREFSRLLFEAIEVGSVEQNFEFF
jgi:hypothetical protein